MAAHRGADQEAAHADHAVQVLALLVGVPADPLVAIAQLDGRRAEPQAAKPAVLGADEVAHLRAHHDAGALGVFAHQLIPQAQVLRTVDLEQLQAADLAGLFGDVLRCSHGHAKAPWRSAFAGPRRVLIVPSGQHKMPDPFELAQRLGAARDLGRTASIEKAKVPAN